MSNSLNELYGSLFVSQKIVDGNSKVHIADFHSVHNFLIQCRQSFANMSNKGEFLLE